MRPHALTACQVGVRCPIRAPCARAREWRDHASKKLRAPPWTSAIGGWAAMSVLTGRYVRLLWTHTRPWVMSTAGVAVGAAVRAARSCVTALAPRAQHGRSRSLFAGGNLLNWRRGAVRAASTACITRVASGVERACPLRGYLQFLAFAWHAGGHSSVSAPHALNCPWASRADSIRWRRCLLAPMAASTPRYCLSHDDECALVQPSTCR